MSNSKKTNIVGQFIKKQRSLVGLSQRALGEIFQPAVTTQFISNVERGVTPLPPNHVATLARALKISESDLMAMLEKEYAAKLNMRLGRELEGFQEPKNESPNTPHNVEREFVQRIYDAFHRSDDHTRQAFATAAYNILKVQLTQNWKQDIKKLA